MIERYVWRGGQFVSKQTGEPMQVPQRDEVCMPRIQSDITAYKSPLGDHWIDGRREQREELKRNGCVINEFPRQTFDAEEYKERKAKQAKVLERRKEDRAKKLFT